MRRSRRPSLLVDILAVIGLVLASVCAAADDSWAITADAWSRPRTAESVAAMAPVKACVRSWMQTPDSRIVILYYGGEAGSLWASQVRGWLVSLGVEPEHIEMRAGNEHADQIQLSLED